MDFDKKTEERIKEFVKERNEALFSLDEKKIKAYMKKYCVPEPHGLQSYMQHKRSTDRSLIRG